MTSKGRLEYPLYLPTLPLQLPLHPNQHPSIQTVPSLQVPSTFLYQVTTFFLCSETVCQIRGRVSYFLKSPDFPKIYRNNASKASNFD